ncbi:MAG: hypothetical protein AABX25_02645 [Nanoarchaeota archaeon]
MVKEPYICKICNFAYKDRETAKKCEDWCKKHKSCDMEITKLSIGILNKKK